MAEVVIVGGGVGGLVKAGVFAEGQAEVVARNIAALVRGLERTWFPRWLGSVR